MAANVVLQRRKEPLWRKGFVNMLRKENRDWWRTRRWWLHLILWLLLLNMAVAAPLWLQNAEVPPSIKLTEEQRQQLIERNSLDNRVQDALRTFVDMSAIVVLLGVVIVMQNSVIDEKQTGTGAWVMSKPVARSSFILAKLVANGGALILLAVVVQWILAYIQFSLAKGAAQPIVPYLLSMSLIALNLLFWLTLTLMLGTLFNNRGMVIAIPLAVLFVMLVITPRVPALLDFTPLAFITDMPTKRSLVQLAMSGQPLQTVLPIIVTTVWCVVFVFIAIWRFSREEF
ncbi:MAG: ABC transporter permease subunit [Anaerolineae bacterium]